MRSADVYCAPNTGGESFGIVLVEAMAAGTAVVASDLDAFRRVLRRRQGRTAGAGRRRRCAGRRPHRGAGERRRARPLRRGGRPRRSAATTGRWSPGRSCGCTRRSPAPGPRCRWPADDLARWWLGPAWSCCWWCSCWSAAWAYPDRQPAGPAARPLRPVLAGARRCAGPPRGGGPRGRRRRLRGRARRASGWPALADAAEQAPRSPGKPPKTNCRRRSHSSTRHRCRSALVAELADAEARVLLARRFHNDAVRDTLALRERPAVRWLRLGGTAALPSYFEIAEQADARRRAWSAAARRRGWCCSTTTARCCCSAGRTRPSPTAAAPRWWFTVGGAGPAGGDADRGRGARAGRGNRPARRRRPTWSGRCGGATR